MTSGETGSCSGSKTRPFIGVDETFGEEWGHSGGIPGSAANIRYLERDGAAQVVLINATTTSDDLRAFVGATWEVLLL
jgi:hypothetical protein